MTTRPPTDVTLSYAPARIAGLYALLGLVWIWLSDRVLVWLGYTDDHAFLAAVAKGTIFVVVTAVLLYWQMRREWAALRRSEDLLRAMAEGTTDAVFVKDRDGRYLFANAATARFVGLPVTALLGRDDREVFNAAEAENLIASDRAIMAGGEIVTVDEALTSAGVNRVYHATKFPFRDADGHVIGLIGISRDISEMKRSEVALRESEARFRELADAIPQIVWVAGSDGGLTHVNARAVEYSGRASSDLLGRSWDESVHPDDLPTLIAERAEAVSRGVARDIEFRLRRADGAYRWHVSRQMPARAPDGTISNWYGTCTDIDDLKQTQNSLREIEARLREAQRIAHLGSWSWDPPSDRVWWSDAEFELFGIDQNAVSPSFAAFMAVLHPDDRTVAVARVEAMRAGANEFANDLRIVRPDGKCIWVHSRARATRDATGALVSVEGIDQDITARKLAEGQAREARRMLRLVLDAVPHAIFWKDRDGRHLGCNAVLAQALGFATPDDLIGRTNFDLPSVTREEAEFFTLKDRDVVESGVPQLAIDETLTLPDGRTINLETYKLPLVDDDGHTIGVVGMWQDVTTKKRAERALQQSETLLQAAVEVAGLGVLAIDYDRQTADLSPQAQDQFGFPSGGPVARSALHDRIHPDDRAELERRVADALSPAGPGWFSMEHRVVRPDGTTRWLSARKQVTFTDGRPHRAVVVTADITSRKQADQDLREKEWRFRSVFEHAGIGIGITDADGRFLECNSAYTRMLGRSEGELRAADLASLIHPDDRQENIALLRRLAVGEIPGYELENRFLRPSGESMWVRKYVTAFGNSAGRAQYLMALVTDVTERRRFDETLRASEERYRRLVEVLPEAVFINSSDRVVYCNPACVRLFAAADESSLVGSKTLDLFTPEYHEAILARIRRMQETGGPVPGLDERIVRLDGRTAPVNVVATPIVDGDHSDILVCMRDLTERERSDALLRSVLGSVSDAILTIDEHGRVESTNPATERLFGYPEVELLGQNVHAIMPEPDRSQHDAYIANFLQTGVAKVIGTGREVNGRRRDGTTFPVELTVTEFQLEGERRFTGVLRDITARKRLEEQFRQSQKMEAVGRLAGGVAHDFNNLLTVINGYCELLLDSGLPAGDRRRESVAAIRDAGERAARLTQQLLAFSRKTLLMPKVLDLNEMVHESARLLRRLIGEDIILAVVTAPTPMWVKADLGQLEQVIMNLAVNARDAMPTGGRLTFETTIAAGEKGDQMRYVCLSVTDTGYGMTDEVKGKIFEPFFTTKGVGKGTGLGLAVVHGVVIQSGGQLSVESTVGVGTTFKLLLPLVAVEASGPTSMTTRLATRGSETILLVEDEDAVRTIARISLETQGYTVLEADGGAEALRQAEAHPGEIHLLLSDVVMPEMGGRQLFEAVRRHRPRVKVLFMSGYTDDAVLLHGVVNATDAFIQKPFTPLSLARKVRDVIDTLPK